MKKIIGFCTILFILLVHPIFASALTTTAFSPSSTKLCNLNPDEKIFIALGIWNNHNKTLVNVTAELIISSNNDNFIISPAVVSLGNINAFSSPEDGPSWLVQCNEPVEGNYTAYVQYEDIEGFLGTSLQDANATIIVDSSDIMPPQIQTHSPIGNILTSHVTLEVSTAEDAFCKYDSNKGISYETMSSSFKITGGLNHKTIIQDLHDNYYSYYVRCKDVYGNVASDDYKISFMVDTPPVAVISLNKDSPLNAGTVEVTLTTSEDVEPIPSLYYSFYENLKTRVPLSGGSKIWKGYIFLENSGNNKIGSFHFYAKDLTGNEGNVIKDGNIFLVDTTPPSPPAMLTAVQQKGHSIKLQWSTPADDEIDYFKIYRLTEDGLSFSFYDSTKENYFTDASVAVGRTYYYAVSTVDEAGNEGELSLDVYATLEGITFPASSQEFTKVERNSTNSSILSNSEDNILFTEIDSSLRDIENILNEINVLREEFQLNDSVEYSLLSPLDTLKENKVSLLKLSEELKSLREDAAILDAQIIFDEIKREIENIKSGTLKKISISEEKTVTLSSQEDVTAELLNDFITRMDVAKSEEEKEAYLAKIKKINDVLKFEVAVKELTLKYLDGRKENALLVEKKIKSSEPLENFSILEYVPKDIASSTDKMRFDKDAVQVIDNDPILLFHFDSLEQAKYSFIINNAVDINKISETATIVLPKFEEFAVQEGNNFLTGLSVSSLSIVTGSWYNMGIAAGVIIIVVLVSYYFIHFKKEGSGNKQVRKKISFLNCVKKKLKGLKTIKLNRNYSDDKSNFYLQYAEKEYGKAGLKVLKNTTMLLLLKEADEVANSMDYEAALKLYHLIISQKNLTLIKNNPKIATQIKIFQSKIDILLKCQELQYCLKKRDFLNMSHVLNNLADLHNSLFSDISKEDIDFIKQIEKIHQRYSEILLHNVSG